MIRKAEKMGIPSSKVVDIYRKVLRNNGKYENYILCKYCKGKGYKYDNRGHILNCDVCDGWGFYKNE